MLPIHNVYQVYYTNVYLNSCRMSMTVIIICFHQLQFLFLIILSDNQPTAQYHRRTKKVNLLIGKFDSIKIDIFEKNEGWTKSRLKSIFSVESCKSSEDLLS